MAATRLRRILGFGVIAGVLIALWRRNAARRPAPAALHAAPAPAALAAGQAPPAETATSWVEPEDGACPVSHPVKAKLSSGIFHAPGAQMYERTRADRCYPDAVSAEADGLRASKR